MTKPTGLYDRDNTEIKAGDFVSLDGNMTTDDSMGSLPNGWTFEEDDVYEVYFDERIQNWSLKMDIELDTQYNIKYMNHAVSLLHDRSVKIIIPQPNKV
jgi:hypothetical protein